MAVYTDGTKLYATTIAELHSFAEKIKLSSKYFVVDGVLVYYYIGGGNIALLRALNEGVQCIREEQIKFTSKPNNTLTHAGNNS